MSFLLVPDPILTHFMYKLKPFLKKYKGWVCLAFSFPLHRDAGILLDIPH